MHWEWIQLLIRSTVILAVAELMRLLPRRTTASYRYRIGLAAFGLLAIWPLFSIILPEIHVPMRWLSSDTGGNVTVQQTIFIPGRGSRTGMPLPWPILVWAAGVIISLVPLVAGYIRTLRMSHQAEPADDAAAKELLSGLCRDFRTKPRLLISRVRIVPLAFGLMRPTILVPAEFLVWASQRQRAVLLHELAHLQRHDVAGQLFASLVTALWWFQPLCWIHRRNLRRESELACDAVVLAAGVRPSDYAAELLEIAQSFGARGSRPLAAIAMARRGELEGRLFAILDSQLPTVTRKLSVTAISVLTLTTLTASAVTLLPEEHNELRGGSSMKRTLLSGLLASAGLSAATISGSLFDPSGAAVPNARAWLYNPDTAAKLDTTTGTDGKFSFSDLPAGQYILRIEKPGFASLFREFKVDADSNVERGLTLNVGTIQEHVNVAAQGEATATQQAMPPKRLRIGGAVQESKLTTKIQPLYPPAAKAAGIQGTVEMEMVISKDGVPEDIRVLRSPSDDLTQSALEAVRQWRYSSTLLNGEPIEVVTDVIVNYTLSK